MVRLTLALGERAEWLKVFDPRQGGVFVATAKPPPVGTEVRVDLTIADGGPRVILKGHVLWCRPAGEAKAPAGCGVGLDLAEREKVNYLNGFVRGGLLNRRERRRLPLRLRVTYGGLYGPCDSVTRDVNEEGLFIVTDDPLPEDTELELVLTLPLHPEPLNLKGVVSHTVIIEDEDIPGMGIRYLLGVDEQKRVSGLIDALESAFHAGTLPDEVIT